jgi:hypothetical protein
MRRLATWPRALTRRYSREDGETPRSAGSAGRPPRGSRGPAPSSSPSSSRPPTSPARRSTERKALRSSGAAARSPIRPRDRSNRPDGGVARPDEERRPPVSVPRGTRRAAGPAGRQNNRESTECPSASTAATGRVKRMGRRGTRRRRATKIHLDDFGGRGRAQGGRKLPTRRGVGQRKTVSSPPYGVRLGAKCSSSRFRPRGRRWSAASLVC